MTTINTGTELSFVTFEVAGMLLGVEIGQVQEIHRIETVTEVPNLSRFVRGVINLRGQLVTLLDLRDILMAESRELPPGAVNVILNHKSERIGLAADCLADVVNVPETAIEPLPGHMEVKDRRHYRGVIQLEDRLLVLIDVDSVMDPDLSAIA